VTMAAQFERLLGMQTALEAIKSMSGSTPDVLGGIIRATVAIRGAGASVVPPDELRETHALFLSAAQLAENAAKFRRQAALTGNMDRAWEASSAAAGAMMLSARAHAEFLSALQLPQLPR
jgi:hypothetical protein